MNSGNLFTRVRTGSIVAVWGIAAVVFVLAVLAAHHVQTDAGRVELSNVIFDNYNGKSIRAKILRPLEATGKDPSPGVLFVHGYQNNRESGDAYAIEFARRGFVVLSIDALGRGNSDVPYRHDDPRFDPTFGTRSSVEYLKKLPFVDARRIGVMGHSMGAKFVYEVALQDSSISAVAVIGSAYDRKASREMPKNMIMIIGELDEFRDFFTGTKDLLREWPLSEATRNAFPAVNPRWNMTYGDFSKGTARKLFVQRISHIQESHSTACVAEALEWMKESLSPPRSYWIESREQRWPIKEAMTLLAMLACFISALPLALLLLRTRFFLPLRNAGAGIYSCETRGFLKYAGINGLLMWLYLPLIMTLFAVHKFVVPVDSVFPMLLVDAIVWWFLWINIIGLILFRSWYRKQSAKTGLTLLDLGVSESAERFRVDWKILAKTTILALVLFGYLYILEYASERLYLVDFRFIYPLVSDLTPYRLGMFFLYFPFILFGFIVLTAFVHGQLRGARRSHWLKTYFSWTGRNVFALVAPLVLFLLVQYVPLLSTGFIPFEGPGGVFVVFILELFFIMLTLTIVMVMSTWFYLITGRIYLSAIMNALIVTWLFASSQVIAPIP